MRIVKQVFMASMVVLVGCSGTSMPKGNPPLQGADFYQKKISAEWAKVEKAVTYLDQESLLAVDSPQKIPDAIYNRPISTSLAANATVSDIAAILGTYGIYLMIPEEEIRTKPISIISYNGKLGDFLSAVGSSYGIAFNWNPGEIMTAETTSQYVMRIPQDKTLIETTEAAITALGAQDVHGSLLAGTVSYRAGYGANKRIINYIQRTSLNASLVSLQVAIINVALNRDQSSGFDWTKLQAKFGDAAVAPVPAGTSPTDPNGSTNGNGSTSNGNTNGTSGTTDTDTTTTPSYGSNWKDLHSFVGLAAEGLTLRFVKDDFDFTGLINALSAYGKTETTQSMMMKTLSGHDVSLSSGQTIPYLESIGVSSTGNTNVNNGSGSNGSGGGLLGSANIKDLKVGLELDLRPVYDYSSDVVTIDVAMKLSSLIKMVEISAGNQIGTVTRPNTQENKFNDVVKVVSGQAVLIGGLTYYQNSDERNNLSVLDNYDVKSASWKNKWTKSAMFILLRPTITVFGKSPNQLVSTGAQ